MQTRDFVVTITVLGLIPAACFGLGLLFAAPAIAQSDAGVAGLVPFDVAPPPVRRCTCTDIEDLIDNMHGGAAHAAHFRDLERDLISRQNQGLSDKVSQDEWVAAEKAFKKPPRDKGAGGGVSATTPAAAETDGATCRSVIPRSNLTRYCDAIIQTMWEHERVHRDLCNTRTKAGKTAYDYPGSYHAGEEVAAYEAGNVILRGEIERVLEESRLTVRATIITSAAASPISHQDSKFVINLLPQGASGDGVVEFVDLTGKGHTQFTSLRHGDCTSKPVNQALTLSVRTVDMQNFTVIYQPRNPQTTRYTCVRNDGFNLPLISMFANRWVQPIRLQRPFPYTALVIIGGSSDGGFPGLPPGMSLPSMDGGFPGLPPGMSLPNMGGLLNPTARDGGVTLPGVATMSLDAGFPNLTPAETPFGAMDTMVTLSCP